MNTLLNIKHVSTKIMKNKFNLFTRLLDGINTATPIMNMIEADQGSFLSDLRRSSWDNNIDLIPVIISRKVPHIVSTHTEIPEDTYSIPLNSLNNWTDVYWWYSQMQWLRLHSNCQSYTTTYIAMVVRTLKKNSRYILPREIYK